MRNGDDISNLPVLSRRGFIGGAIAVAALACKPSFANYAPPMLGCRRLALTNLHTGESLKTVYWEDGKYQTDALESLSHLLRDHRSNEIHAADTNLLDMLSALQDKTSDQKPWQVISAFRSESTNEKLRKSGSGVARKSYHCVGKAIDVRLSNVSLKDLHKAALSLRAGGVGYYPKSGFIHLDTGPTRSW